MTTFKIDLTALSQETFEAVTRDRIAGYAALTEALAEPKIVEIAEARCRECTVEAERRIDALRTEIAKLEALQ